MFQDTNCGENSEVKIKIPSIFREITGSKKVIMAKVGFELGLKEQIGVHKRVRKIGQRNLRTYLKGKFQRRAIVTNLST